MMRDTDLFHSDYISGADDYRDYRLVAPDFVGECSFCAQAAYFHVTERFSLEEALVCSNHKWTAFS